MLEVKQVYKQYQDQTLLEGISLVINASETVCILGPSGGGKSTLLRIIAGLEPPDRGSIWWAGKDISNHPAHLRQFGFMFQDYALFPHMSVWENVAFGLQMQRLNQPEIEARCRQALEMVHMEGFMNRRVTDLSGGEQQRVALARTLAPRPRLLMLDEPLGALDRTLRASLSAELRNLLHHIHIPVVYVTHDQDEAFSIADRVIILNQGHIVQSGSPHEVYTHPRTLWLASFLGLDNRITGRVVASDPLQVKTALGVFHCDCAGQLPSKDQIVTLVIRPTGALVCDDPAAINAVQGQVEDAVFNMERYKISVLFEKKHTFTFFLNGNLPQRTTVCLSIQPQAILCYSEE